MTGEEKCNRCEQFGPNGLTDYPCKRIPSRNCPWFIKISDKKYKKILADRVKRIKDNEKLKQEMMKDQDLVEEVKAINICGDINSFIKHIIYVSVDKVSSDRAFVNNDVLYMVTYASIKGKNIPVGVLAKQKEAKTEDIAMPFEDIGRDVNVVYPIEIGKMFKGFYILSNGAVAIDYELTDNGGFDDDDNIGKIDMNLN